MRKEGFWWSEYESAFPKPIEHPVPEADKEEFLTALVKKEKIAHVTYYKGYSHCRICECRNGTTEFRSGSWIWPEGYEHYIEKHNVHPSAEFKQFILGDTHGQT